MNLFWCVCRSQAAQDWGAYWWKCTSFNSHTQIIAACVQAARNQRNQQKMHTNARELKAFTFGSDSFFRSVLFKLKTKAH